jgi:hypothetical protein
MFLNILIGFVIPWIFGVILFLKNRKLVLVIAPISAVISYSLNEIGFHMHLWRLAPLSVSDDLTSMSVNLGFFPILACYLVYYIKKTSLKKYTLILIFSFLNTIFEFICVLLNMVSYGNRWNVIWTFLSYIAAYLLVYGYFHLADKYEILNNKRKE